ncbi:MAG: TonB family protein, partial [Polyangiales bacterium]
GRHARSPRVRVRGVESEPARQARVPRLRSSGPEVRGSLDPALIRRVVRRHTNETRHCFERALQSRPDLEGRVQAQFIIAPNGAVTTANIQSSTLRHQAAEACVLDVVRRMTFPATPHGNISIVTYPWVFSAV